MIGGSTSASPIATRGEYGRMASPRPPKNAMTDKPAAISIDPKPTGLNAYSMPRRNSGCFGDSFSRYLLNTMSEATTTTHAMPQFGVEAEDRVEEVEHVGFHQDQRDQQVHAEEHNATRVGLGDAGERVGPCQRTRVGVRHVDLDLADDHQARRPMSLRANRAGSSGRSPGTGAPAGWRCPRCPRRWRSGTPPGTVRRSA